MKKYLGLFAVLAVMFALNVQTLHAQDGQSGAGGERLKLRTEMRTNMLEKMQALREDAKQGMDKLKAELRSEKDATKAKIKELRITGREMALQRFDMALERINNLKDRVNGEITKMDARGVDVTGAEGFVVTATTKLTDAKDKVAEINILLSTSINELTLENKTKLRTLAQDTQALIVEAHRALRDAVKSLKDALKVK